MRNYDVEAALLAFSPARRGFCPSRRELVAYYDSELPVETMAALRNHLAACPFCASDLADLTALATPPLIEAVVAWVADGLRLIAHSFSRAEGLQPALARAGSSASAAPAAVELVAPAEGGELSVQVRRNPNGPPDLRVRLTGQSSGRVRISLYRQEALLESRVSDDDEVVFGAVEPGSYHISAAPLERDELARVHLQLVDERSTPPRPD